MLSGMISSESYLPPCMERKRAVSRAGKFLRIAPENQTVEGFCEIVLGSLQLCPHLISGLHLVAEVFHVLQTNPVFVDAPDNLFFQLSDLFLQLRNERSLLINRFDERLNTKWV